MEVENLQDYKNMIEYIDKLKAELKRMEHELERFKLRVKFHPELLND